MMNPPCQPTVLGDASKPMQLELIAIGGDRKIHTLTDCGGLDILEPPQGGRVSFIGIRATNIASCALTINAALRDPASMGVLGAEMRTVILEPSADRPGWGQTGAEKDGVLIGYANFANVALCPNSNGRDVQRLEGLVDVHVTDSMGKKGQVRMLVVPRCGDPDPALASECECECAANFTDSKCATFDAGPTLDAGICLPTH